MSDVVQKLWGFTAEQMQWLSLIQEHLVKKLTPSLLARAFRGQLVPQDPTDEPAEKLLERMTDLSAKRKI